jgi:predicted dehydrogenase
MKKEVFSCVLVGLGDIGLNYDLNSDQDKYVRTHARAFSLHSGFNLQAGVDIDIAACNKFSRKYNVKSYTKIEDALFEIKPDLIVLAVPTCFQLDTIKKIEKYYKPKAILCEKPMGIDLHQGQEIVNTCKKMGASLYVNYIRRCLPGSVEIKRRIDEGLIKAPYKCIVWYSKGLSHNGSHFINLIEYWFGIFSNIDIVSNSRKFKGFGSEPYVFSTFENCEVSFIPAWEEHYSHYTIELISATGRLYWGKDSLEWTGATESEHLNGYRYLSDKIENIFIGNDKYQMHIADQLYLAMTTGSNSICNGSEALETLRTIDVILTKDDE